MLGETQSLFGRGVDTSALGKLKSGTYAVQASLDVWRSRSLLNGV